MRNLVLIGMMGCGKSTAARLLAQELELEAVDTDQLIEAREGRSIPDIFAQSGEDCFRELEAELCRELARREGLVIACGGGLPMRPDCIGPLKTSGTVVFLERDPNDIYDNVNMEHRPLGQVEREAFLERYRQREPVYRRWADRVVSTRATAAETLEAILEVLR